MRLLSKHMRGNEQIAASAESLLQWWSDAGVDCLVDEAPRDWLRPTAAATLRIDASTPRTEAPKPILPDQLDLFRAYLVQEESLPFALPAAPRVCPSGDPAAGLMMLTHMPDAADCGAGALLSGPAGQLFDRMLAAIGRDRASIYLASLSCLRSPNGDFPGDSAAHCAALARHHVALAAPKALLLLGDACCKALLGLSVVQARGRWHALTTPVGEVATLASFHPSYLLDQPAAKRYAWADLQMLMGSFQS
jgi:DNA polymerase